MHPQIVEGREPKGMNPQRSKLVECHRVTLSLESNLIHESGILMAQQPVNSITLVKFQSLNFREDTPKPQEGLKSDFFSHYRMTRCDHQ